MNIVLRRAIIQVATAVVIATAGCSDSAKPSTPQFSQDEMMKQAEQQRQSHEKLLGNRK
jgi:hypothetical protein